MKTKTIEPKCPYCKLTIPHNYGSKLQNLWREYSPENIDITFVYCDKHILVSCTQIYKYSSKKLKGVKI